MAGLQPRRKLLVHLTRPGVIWPVLRLASASVQTEASTILRWRAEPGAVLGFHKKLARTFLVSSSDLERRLASGPRWSLPKSIEEAIGASLSTDRRGAEEILARSRTATAPLRSFAVPETLHFELTGACPFICASCYLERDPAAMLSWERLRDILEQALDLGVLQVAFGGGEPLAYPHLEAAIALAARHGLGVSVTTSGSGADAARLLQLREAGLDHLQVSVPEQAGARDHRLEEAPWAALRAARAAGLSAGANIVASSAALEELPGLVAKAHRGGARMVNLLRPKPAAYDLHGWFERNRLHGDAWRRLAHIIGQLRCERPDIHLTLDSALSPLVRLLPRALCPSPIAGCAAGRRFAAVDRDGHFKACSHLKTTEGTSSLGQFWRSSPLLAELRQLEDRLDGYCGACPDVDRCRGCRAIACATSSDFDCWRGD